RGPRGGDSSVRRVPPETGRGGEECATDQLSAQPGVTDLADHRPVRKREPLALFLR
nr:hypothetical protein [Tanacetum cinerariifolium]